jgi:hypothetical protein
VERVNGAVVPDVYAISNGQVLYVIQAPVA